MIARRPRPADVLRLPRAAAAALGYSVLGLLYVPIVGLGLLSFSARPLSGIPWPLTLRLYRDLFSGNGASWADPTWTSVILAVVVAVLSTGVAVLIGRSLPMLRHRLGLLAAYLSVLIMPGILVGIAVLIFYRGLLQIRTGLWSILLVHFIWALPFSLLCVLLVAIRFDRKLLDAARDLGAGPWRQFRDIELPLLKPGISASLFFSFLLSFNELPRTIYARGGITTLPYYIWTASAAHSSQVSLIYALSAVIMAVSLVLTGIAIHLLTRNDI